MPHTGEDFHLVGFDPHTSSPTVPPLASGQLFIDLFLAYGNAGREALENTYECPSMGFTSCVISNHARTITSELRRR